MAAPCGYNPISLSQCVEAKHFLPAKPANDGVMKMNTETMTEATTQAQIAAYDGGQDVADILKADMSNGKPIEADQPDIVLVCNATKSTLAMPKPKITGNYQLNGEDVLWMTSEGKIHISYHAGDKVDNDIYLCALAAAVMRVLSLRNIGTDVTRDAMAEAISMLEIQISNAEGTPW